MRDEDRSSGKITVKDEYTGKTISFKRADIDHGVSVKKNDDLGKAFYQMLT